MSRSAPDWETDLGAATSRSLSARERRRRFVALYEANVAFVWRTLRRFGLKGCQVEDATQDVFLIAHRKLDDFDDASPRAWLAAIARRVAADTRRRNARHPVVARESQHDLALSREALKYTEDQGARAAAAELVHRLLDVLDEAKREVFVLAELEGMRMPEVAAATDCNINTAYSRLRAARLQIKAEYARVVAREKWWMP